MIKKLLVIFLVFITANFLMGSFVTKENEWTYKQSYLQAANYPHEWYLVGSSRTRLGISSQLLSKESNQMVYNLSPSAFFMPTNWTQLESLLGTVSGKKLIIELAYNITSVDYHPTVKSRVKYLLDYYRSAERVNDYSFEYTEKIVKNFLRPPLTITDLVSQEGQKVYLQNKFDLWGEDADSKFQLIHRPNHVVDFQERSKELKSNYKKVILTGKPNEYYLQKVQHLLVVARKNHNEVYFYLPTTLNETEAGMLSCVWPYIPEANRIKTYEDPRFYQLMNEDVLFDEGHLNKKGSKLLTDIIIKQLRLKNVIPPLSSQPTASSVASPQK